MKLEDLLKGTPHEGEPTTKPPRAASRMDEIEAALVELAELIAGEEDEE
ncbi:MAG: hypothetical protein J6V72_11690 [Kiritimatiellae bacterium]|nr:hypothetical protein [Kiritimatiellia bacterium]